MAPRARCRPTALVALVVVLCLLAAATARALEEDEPAVSPADLLAPEVFADACFGMRVSRVEEGPVVRVTTTGAEFLLSRGSGTIECGQRIGKKRRLATIRFSSGTLEGLRLTHQSSGAAVFNAAGATVRINGDSLLMVRPTTEGGIRAELSFTPDYHSEFVGNYNFFDPHGGISFFEHGLHPGAVLVTSPAPVRVAWPWRPGDVFWVAVSPPKPFDWEASLRERVVMHGSSVKRYMHPSDLAIYRFSRYGTVLYLHTEDIWEHWQLSMVPHNPPEYARVMETAHEHGMKVAVYASPKHFIKGTVVEHLATPSVNSPNSTGWHTGSNERSYLEQARRIVHEFGTDGLYLDEMYCNRKALATQYHLIRALRELVGDDGPLLYHCTEDALGDRRGASGATHCPTLHAYCSAVVKGEAEWARRDSAYTRYVLCTYNVSNAVGVQVIDDRFELTPDLLRFWLECANVRFFLPENWFFSGRVELLRKHYWPRLVPGLREQIEPGLLKPTGDWR